MAWPWLFSNKKRNTCTVWSYTFEVTPQHLTKADTAKMKMEYDRLGEAALDRLNVLFPLQASIRQTVEGSKRSAADGLRQSPLPRPPKRDLYILLRDHALEDEALGELWAESSTVPP
ncbi:MAG: hypothetical protein Q9213_007190, partial [Squamulea squamosa]